MIFFPYHSEFLQIMQLKFVHSGWLAFVFPKAAALDLYFSRQNGIMNPNSTDKEKEMEEKFIAAWMANREKAARMGVRLRPMEASEAMKTARRALSGNRVSDGFNVLADKKHLELSLEALAVDKRFTQLFTDEEANTALMRLLDAGYRF